MSDIISTTGVCTIVPARIGSTVPAMYRLVRRNGELTLQGYFTWQEGWAKSGGDWKDIPTIEEQS